MLYGFDLKQLFYFPIENQEARKNFLIGSLLILAGFIIPIIPSLIVIGYVMQIMRQVMNGDKPHMVAWDNWETLLKNGAKVYGVSLIYSLPLLILMFPMLLFFFVMPFLATMSDKYSGLFSVSFLMFPLFFICLMPLSLGFSLIVPAAEAHVTYTGSFSAGFQVGEWWAIFRKNSGGFIVAFCIFMGFSVAASFIYQIAFMTVILICAMPFILPILSMYLLLIRLITAAQAYREGRERLSVQK